MFDNKEYQRKWREKNRIALRDYYRQYRADHSELKCYQKDYHQRNKERDKQRKLETNKVWRKANRAKVNQWRRIWCSKNPEAARQIELRHRRNRREKKREADRQYRITNSDRWNESVSRAKAKKPEHYKALAVIRVHRRRSRIKAAAVEDVSRAVIISRDRSLCHLCLKPVKPCEESLDHLIPVVRQGATAEWNLMLAHKKCNRKRGIKQILLEETKEHAIAYIQERIAAAFNIK